MIRERIHRRRNRAAGMTLVELLVALVVLSIGILSAVPVFVASQQVEAEGRMRTAGIMYAQEKLELLRSLGKTSPELSPGRHPSGSACESLGGGAWQRYYEVEAMPAPLSELRRVIVTVRWASTAPDSLQATGYVR